MKRLRAGLGNWLAVLFKPLFSLLAIVGAWWSRGPSRFFRQSVRFFAFVFFGLIRSCASLNYRWLLQGLPALVAGVIALLVLGLTFFTPAQDIENRYLERAQTALKAKDYSEAVLCYERLADIQSDRPDIVYELAIATKAAGHPERCARLMHQLAPPDRQGYPKAHLWQAEHLLTTANSTQHKQQLAETHLLRAIQGGVEDKGLAHGLLGGIYLSKRLLDQAETLLLTAIKTKPEFRLVLAVLYEVQGKPERSRAEANAAINYFSNVAKADQSAHYHRLRWAEATAFVKDFPQAVAILQ
jgi:tetratricopeptide (TPR) repeat protein